MIDLSHVRPRHDGINLRLEEWARWVKVKPQAWAMQPMFRLYKAPKQWESDAHITIAINTLAAHEIERAVSMLPDKHRTAIRWLYVYPYIPINRARGRLGVTKKELAELIDAARDMLINRLKERLHNPDNRVSYVSLSSQ